MVINEAVITLPFHLPSWRITVKYITEVNKDIEKLKTISDIINVLNHIKNLFEGVSISDYFEESFSGLGMFLQTFSKSELQYFIKYNLQQLLYYVQMTESLVDSSLLLISFENNVIKLNMAVVKSLLACCILCLMPQRPISTSNTSCDQFINFSLTNLFQGVNFGSKKHAELLQSLLQYFSNRSKDLIDREKKIFVTISLSKANQNHVVLSDVMTSWPVVLICDSTLERPLIQQLENVWPVQFEDLNPFNHSCHLKNQSNRSLSAVCPFLVVVLPLLTMGSSDVHAAGVISINYNGSQHTLYRVLPLESWSGDLQFSTEYIETNMVDSFLAFQSLMMKYLPPGTNSNKNVTDTIIEDAINKLNLTSNSMEIFSWTRSNINGFEPKKFERTSLTNIFSNQKRPRDASISGSSSSSRSARQSYSTSSSSRSGSMQFSTFSSRRSSSISAAVAANKDSETGNCTSIDKSDFQSHNFHPIIFEESNIQPEDEECMLLSHQNFPDLAAITASMTTTDTQFEDLMSAPISDSTKLSLSKDYLHIIGEKSQGNYLSKRRNSSPTIGSFISKDSYKVSCEMSSLKSKPVPRCCEEDASNNRLLQSQWLSSTKHGRRQSLPCHLQWLYELPLTDSTKLDMSESQILVEEVHENLKTMNSAVLNWSDNFVDNCFQEVSDLVLKGIIDIANNVLLPIVPDQSRRNYQTQLRKEILLTRQKTRRPVSLADTVDFSEDPGTPVFLNDALHSTDLATFHKELFSSSFFDDEALKYFRNFSNTSDKSTVRSALCDSRRGYPVGQIGDNSDVTMLRTSKNESLLDYVSHLTNTIISDAIIEESKSFDHVCCGIINAYADQTSVGLIASSLAELSSQNKNGSRQIPPIYIGPFPAGYCSELGVLLQMLSAAISQYQSRHSLILVYSITGDPSIKEVVDIITQNRDQLTPFRVYNIILQYFSSTSRVSRPIKLKDYLLNFLSQ